MKEPNSTLPRALFLTLGLTALIYAAVVWIAVTAVPPAELARSSAPLALVFERLTGMPLVTMSAVAIVATLNGIIVHMIMISRVIYGLSDQGSLPKAFAQLNPLTHTPLLATAVAVGAILAFALAVPLAGLADLTSRLTLVIFAVINLALIRIKGRNEASPLGAFICPRWVPFAGLTSSVLLLALDLIVR
jgi:amino acid transporter